MKKRIISLPFMMAGIIILNFLLFHFSPGDPTNAYFSPKVNPETYDTLREKMGLDDPWYLQLYNWTVRALRGDLGYSWSRHRPVSHVLRDALPATLQLTIAALLLNMFLGCFMGLLAGIKSNRLLGKTLDFVALVLYAIPPFWLAIFLIYLFSTQLNVLPPSGMKTLMFEEMTWIETFWDRIRHITLPAVVLGLVGAVATFRLVSSNMTTVLRENYITFAKAKGLPERVVFLKHALRNSLLPLVTLLGLYLPILFGGAFIIEVIFAWPGMGRVTYDAIFARDYPLLMAINFIVAMLVLLGNTIADMLYRFIDPRVQID